MQQIKIGRNKTAKILLLQQLENQNRAELIF